MEYDYGGLFMNLWNKYKNICSSTKNSNIFCNCYFLNEYTQQKKIFYDYILVFVYWNVSFKQFICCTKYVEILFN